MKTDRILQIGNIAPAERQRSWRNPQSGRYYDPNGISPCCTTGLEVLVAEPLRIKQATEQGWVECPAGGVLDINHPNSPTRRGRVQENGEISPAVTTTGHPTCLYEGKAKDGYRIRKLTEREIGRLMDVSEADLDKMLSAGISKTQLYKCFGNSIVVSCLDQIFESLYFGQHKPQQQTLF